MLPGNGSIARSGWWLRAARLPCRALTTASPGHLTVRDSENPGLYWTNPMVVHFSHVQVSNLILADHSGRVVEGRHAINRAGFVLHSAVHEQYPDIVAMCHAHTAYGVAFASLGKKLNQSRKAPPLSLKTMW